MYRSSRGEEILTAKEFFYVSCSNESFAEHQRLENTRHRTISLQYHDETLSDTQQGTNGGQSVCCDYHTSIMEVYLKGLESPVVAQEAE